MSGPTSSSRLLLPSGADRAEWLEARRGGVTATDVVKVVGLSRYGDALSVYLDKLGAPDTTPLGEAGRWGTLLEDEVAREWSRRSGHRVRRVGLVAHRDHPHHLASCDRMINGLRVPLEVKTRAAWKEGAWADGQVPKDVEIQCQWQMRVLGVDRVHVAALIGGQRLISAVVTRDDLVIDYLRDKADALWTAVQCGEPPQPQPWTTAHTLDRLHPDRAGAVDVDPAAAQRWLSAYRDACDLEKQADILKAEARVQLLALLGDGDTALVDGVERFSYRATTRQHIPAAGLRALRQAHPDIAGEYITTSTARTFRVSNKGTTDE